MCVYMCICNNIKKWMAHHNAIYLVMRDDDDVLELDCVVCCVV